MTTQRTKAPGPTKTTHSTAGARRGAKQGPTVRSEVSSNAGEIARIPLFELADQDGVTVTSEGLRGAPYILYFYPRDNTSGCTTEACDFRDYASAFEALGIRVLGASPDSAKSHRGFADKHGLPFTLLADTEKSLAQALGVYKLRKLYGKESLGIVRSTFLVDAEGRVLKAWRGVKVAGHVEAVLAAAPGLI